MGETVGTWVSSDFFTDNLRESVGVARHRQAKRSS